MGPERNVNKFNPFPGLRPFLPEESDLFFGREGESEEVLGKLLKNRFVTVMGASGTGKSSLIYCGILPRVRKMAEGGTRWKILTFRPGNDPLGNLAEVIIQSINPNDTRESFKHEITSALSANPDALSVLIKDLVIRDNEKVLILVDQFEELFRYSMTGSGASPGRSAITFVSLLENAVTQTGTEIYSIITMRSDFIGECAHFQGFTQLINSSNYLVPHMNSKNYRAAIEGPVKYAGASIDPKLVDTLLNDIGDQTDQLPVLQHALMRTWAYWQELDDPGRAISFSEYDAVGTMTDAMSRHADEAFEELSPRGREICEKTFRTITEKGADNKGIRHPMKVSAIKNIVGCSGEELFEVVGRFRITSRSFITPRENIPLDDDSIIDVSHESLMRLWDRLRQWVDDEASSVQMYLRLSEASAMYQQGKTTLWRPPDLQLAINWREQRKPTLQWAERYDPAFERAMVYLRTSEKEYLAEEENKIRLQKRQVKRAKIIAIILGTAALISVAFMLFAFVQKIAADRATDLAEKNALAEKTQRNRADSTRVVAEKARVEADSSKIAALEQKAIADTQRIEAFNQRTQAQINAREATLQSIRANREADSARAAQERAERNRIFAEQQSEIAKARRMLAIGKQMSIKSLQAQDRDLQTLLAYQAYLFNTRNGGEPNDADVYQGLYNVARKYGNVNYKTFKGHTGYIKSVAFVPGKREFYSSAYDGKVMKWNLDSKEQNIQVVYSGTEIIEILAVSPNAEWLACGGNNSVIKMIPIKGGSSMQYELKGHTLPVKSLVFSYDGKYLYSASLDGQVLKWDLAARTSVSENPEQIKINCIDLSSNGNYLAGVSSDGKALVWNTQKRSEIFRVPVESPGRNVKVVRFKPSENTVAIGYTDGYVELWDVTTQKRISMVKAHDYDVNDIRFNPGLSQMATGSNDKKLKLWDINDLTTPPITFDDNGMEGNVMVIEFSPDGNLIISGTYENTDNLVGRPTSMSILASDICSTLTRNMTTEEWSVYAGKDVTYEKTCSEKEFNIKVNVIR
jgi:WD40 repeat protein